MSTRLKSMGFRCREDIFKSLINRYDCIVESKYQKDYLIAIKNFDDIAEGSLRETLNKYYSSKKSADQAWKSCKGSLYEYAVYRALKQIIEKSSDLKNEYEVIGKYENMELFEKSKEQITIENWNKIYPDIDLIIINKKNKEIKAIISCKTSLRERLTETAFWKRELEKTKHKNVKVMFITIDKDKELKEESNRYIIHHVLDYVFITDPNSYNDLVKHYQYKYRNKVDLVQLISKIRPIDKFTEILSMISTMS